MIDLERIKREIEGGYVLRHKHPSAPLWVYNYTYRAQIEGRWTAETRACRGLILDESGSVVARPFEKFFTLEQHPDPLPVEPFDVYDKLDGSLGILYFLDGSPLIATRGSFDGAQAVRANQILYSKYKGLFGALDSGLTYLFEIIYPENRVVIDYGDREDLVLLTVIETASGRELGPLDLGFPIVERYDGLGDLDPIGRLTFLWAAFG